MTSELIVYSTQTCATCNAAKRQLTAAGVPFTPVMLEEDPAAHQRLKDAGMERVPVFEWRNELHTIVGLSAIMSEAQAEIASKTAVAA